MSGLAGLTCSILQEIVVALDHQDIVRALLAARSRISAAVFLVVRDAQTAEDIFQDVSVKGLSDDVSFEGEPQLVSGPSSPLVIKP